MFAASEWLRLVNTQYQTYIARFLHAFKYPVVLIRGSIIGVFVAAVPGVGSSVLNVLSYIGAKRQDLDSLSFGRGNPKGVIASESANSIYEAGSMATLLVYPKRRGDSCNVSRFFYAQFNW